MQVAVHNKVKVYNLTSGKSLPEWLSERKKNRKLAAGEQRIELLHDLEFPHFSRCLFRTLNGTHLFAAGDYPPRIKCFDVNQLSMKYSFNADMPILGGVSLSADYRKFALRGEGRQITIHHSSAIIDRIRVPHMQRCLAYHENTAELLSSGASSEIFRFNLETGAFVESWKVNVGDGGHRVGVNHVEVFPKHGLTMTAGTNGVVEAWDSRTSTPSGSLTVAGPGASSGLDTRCEITHVSCDAGGLLFACGTDQGQVLLYDLRLNRPLIVKDHMNGLPIVKTYFFKGASASTGESTHLLSADTRAVKIWNRRDGSNFTTIEAPAEIYDFAVLRVQHNMTEPYECDDSGILAICCDTPRVQVHFIPQLGIAPRWASFLDTITEELEEKEATVVYDDYQFISKDEMAALGISTQDITDGRVRPSMHGCFVEKSLYRELKAVVDPTALNKYTQAAKQKKRDERKDSRISQFRRVERPDDAEEGAGEKDDGGASAAFRDPRFAGKLSANAAAFALDQKNPEYAKLLQKVEARRNEAANRRQRYDSEMFTIVPDEGRHRDDGEEESDGYGSDDQTKNVASELTRSNLASSSNQKRGGKGAPSRDQNNKKDLLVEGAGAAKKIGEKRTVAFFEAKSGVNFLQTDKETHADRKRSRSEKLSLEERLKRTRK